MPEFDRFAPPHLDDPYPLYARLREGPPFFADAFGVWVVTRRADVKAVLSDPARFSSEFLIRTPMSPAPGVAETLATGHPEVFALLNQDPPEHTRVRALVAAAFSPRRVRALTPRVERLAGELVDAIAADGAADLIRSLALPLPLLVICELIGIPRADAPRVRGWIEQLKVLTSFGASDAEQVAAAHGSVEFERYLAALIAQRRAHGRDDLLTDVLRGDLTDLEIISLLITLIFGGHETTTNLIGNALLAALARPEGLPDDPDDVIERTLRADPPVQGTFRRTVADTELGGAPIPAGAQLYAALGAANHDPDGSAEPHLAFGRGIHYCVGAQLARVEARIALRTLATRLPGLRAADGFRVSYPANLLHRGPIRLAATWPVPSVH
ncbi:hypothetical protein [Catenuloplanes atrovinosus]|uniref:Cytochrome P450 n=1 Tax=Catenuloplanes atrovinosus TaxID=137266 RepID=A0AAE3YIM5_9ACTN|nr:hypothetical protein [Catenuloplanes atrovinosus]MDR7274553.1 cytochrome P450 [Catenuloplanes atrovinosus]